jgi:small-conductance mechanosensitive channel
MASGTSSWSEPAKATGIVEEFSLRTTVLRSLNGDRAYVPNSQVIPVVEELAPGMQVIVCDHANLPDPWFQE